MKKPRIYTIGYAGRTPEGILALMNERGAVLADVRFKPYSRFQPHWNGKALANLLGPLYLGVPELGNRNYKGGPIEIVDYEAGKAAILDAGKPVILMCCCKDHATCHRTTVAEMLRSDGFTVEEIGMEPAPKDDGRGIPGAVENPAPKRGPQQTKMFR